MFILNLLPLPYVQCASLKLGGEVVFGVLMAREVSLFDKCLVILLVVAVAGIVLVLANSLAAKSPEAKVMQEEAKPAGLTCPSPTVVRDGKCILTKDVVLNKTLWLGSNTILDCRGRKILPSNPGVVDNASTDNNEFNASIPEVAILVHNASGVTIQNCIIGVEGNTFDFGILAVDIKNPPSQNKILQNSITARTTTILLEHADNHLIQGNTLIRTSNSLSRGVWLDMDSDNNTVLENTITSIGRNATGFIRIYPGGGPHLDPGHPDAGVFVEAWSQDLLNLIVDNQLIQIDITEEAAGSSKNNLIENNTVSYQGLHTNPRLVGAIEVATGATATVIRGNTINSGSGVKVGYGGLGQSSNFKVETSGRCSRDQTRLCVDNSACFIEGFDTSSKGVCNGHGSTRLDLRVRNSIIENNIIRGPFSFSESFPFESGSGILLVSHINPIVRNNQIIGSGIPRGIIVSYDSLETAIVERNTVDGASTGIFLIGGFSPSVNSEAAKFFGMNFSLNDITGYTTAVMTDNDYNFDSELSVDGKGNYWGLNCTQSDGFDPTKVINQNGQIENNVVDSHPYGVPIANTPDASLPATLPGKCS